MERKLVCNNNSKFSGFILSMIPLLMSFAYIAVSEPILETNTTPVLETKEELNTVLSNYVKRGDKLALMLDYDGTLSVIQANNSNNRIINESKTFLQHILENSNIFTVIISGREVHDLRNRTGINEITYSGNHGLEILYTNQTLYTVPLPDEVVDNYPKLRDELLEKWCKNGAWLQKKGITMTYHYKELPEELHKAYTEQVQEIAAHYGYLTHDAHDSTEINPPIFWNKGNASNLILNQNYGENWFADGVKVIFAGDDNTDERAMKALTGKSLLFRISNLPGITTSADYVVPSVKSITNILEWINSNL